MPKIATILIFITIAGLIYGSIKRGINEKKLANEPAMPLAPGPYTVSWPERILQGILVLCTAIYALWVLGIRSFIRVEVAKGGDMRPLIITLIAAVVFIAGFYFYLIYVNRQKLAAAESRRSPNQRLIGYLKIIAVWAFFIVIDLFVIK